MTKLELSVSATTFEVIRCDDLTARVLNCGPKDHISNLLADKFEFEALEEAIQKLIADPGQTGFETLNLVFKAPSAEEHAFSSDRSPIVGVFRSPLQAIHMCGVLEIAAFTHVHVAKDGTIMITALELSREYRKWLLKREFGSWLLEEHIENAVIATTMTGDICFWNRFATELYGWQREDVMGKNIMAIMPSEMTVEQGMEIMTRLQKGEHWKGYFRVQRRDKTNFMAHVTDTPIMGVDGNVKFIVGISADYTVTHNLMDQLQTLNADLEKEIESRTEQLLLREKLLRRVGAAVKASETGVVITDEHDKIIWSNNAVFDLLASNENSLKGLSPGDLPLLKEVVKWRDFLKMAMTVSSDARTPVAEFDVRGLLPIDYLSVSVQTLHLEESAEQQHMITIRDITTVKRAEALQLAAEKAAAMSKANTEMMQMLSHELRSPLQGIMGVTSTMLADATPNKCNCETYDEISAILASSRLLLTLINTVLDIRKMDSNMMQAISLSPVGLIDCMDRCIHFCSLFASQQKVDLRIDLPRDRAGDKFSVVANRLKLDQILINLITNSIKYTVSGTEVIVTARVATTAAAMEEVRAAACSDLTLLPPGDSAPEGQPCGKMVIVSIRDFGGGIPPNEYHKVFGEFSQLSISAEKDAEYGTENSTMMVAQSAGSGLGLNLVRKFITAMHGHVWFNNCTDGPGVEFSICLPSATASVKTRQSVVTNSSHCLSATNNVAARFRALVVDDSMINSKVLSKMLSRLGCSQIESVNRGAKALDYLQSVQSLENANLLLPNLIILDLDMPEMNGYELVRRIRELDWEPRPIAMAWSADWASEVEAKCTSAGFDGVLSKPLTIFDLEDILVRLTTQLDGPQRSTPAFLIGQYN